MWIPLWSISATRTRRSSIWTTALTEEQLASVDSAIRSTPGVVSATYVSPEDVLANYSSMLDDYANMYEPLKTTTPFSGQLPRGGQ